MDTPTEFPRRAFLTSCATLAAALSGCHQLLPRTRLGRLAVNDPHPDDYRPVLHAALQTLLPFDHPDFPALAVEEVADRFLALFPTEAAGDYENVQRALVFFDAVDLFPLRQPVFVGDELELFGASGEDIETRLVADRTNYDRFVDRHNLDPASETVTRLSSSQRVDYLRLWSRSAFGAKRSFYRSLKSMTMITCYTLPPFWHAIGYDGPLIEKGP